MATTLPNFELAPVRRPTVSNGVRVTGANPDAGTSSIDVANLQDDFEKKHPFAPTGNFIAPPQLQPQEGNAPRANYHLPEDNAENANTMLRSESIARANMAPSRGVRMSAATPNPGTTALNIADLQAGFEKEHPFAPAGSFTPPRANYDLREINSENAQTQQRNETAARGNVAAMAALLAPSSVAMDGAAYGLPGGGGRASGTGGGGSRSASAGGYGQAQPLDPILASAIGLDEMKTADARDDVVSQLFRAGALPSANDTREIRANKTAYLEKRLADTARAAYDGGPAVRAPGSPMYTGTAQPGANTIDTNFKVPTDNRTYLTSANARPAQPRQNTIDTNFAVPTDNRTYLTSANAPAQPPRQNTINTNFAVPTDNRTYLTSENATANAGPAQPRGNTITPNFAVPTDNRTYVTSARQQADAPAPSNARLTGDLADLARSLQAPRAAPVAGSKGYRQEAIPGGGSVIRDVATNEILEPSKVVKPEKPVELTPLTSAEIDKVGALEQAQTDLNVLKQAYMDIGRTRDPKTGEMVGKTDVDFGGPLAGRLKGLGIFGQNETITRLNNLMAAATGNLAKGVLREVGQLTKEEYDRYQSLFPSPKDTAAVRARKFEDLSARLTKGIESTLGTFKASGRDVSGFEKRFGQNTAPASDAAPSVTISPEAARAELARRAAARKPQ
jgi:hypothetical protein